MEQKFDLIIVGAGPAGFATAYSLRHSGLRIALVDKATFPREKVCGDGLTLDVLRQLTLLSPELRAAFDNLAAQQACCGAVVWAPSRDRINLPVNPDHPDRMATCRRIDFDHLLIRQLKPFANITLFEGCTPSALAIEPGRVVLTTQQGTFEAPMVVGADGVNSFVARQTGTKRIGPDDQCVALRTYYRGVKPPNDRNPIEMFLLREILPGYVWIFHLADGTANVGVGVLGTVIRKRGIRLKPLFEELLRSEPLKSRLLGAERIEEIKGMVIPLGGARREISGERFLLVGDAATLVDPITGEGVGSALRSGRVAAAHIERCIQAGNYSAPFNRAYDAEIYRRMMPEFRLHRSFRRLLNHPWLISHIVGAAAANPVIEKEMLGLMWNIDAGTAVKTIRFAARVLWLFTFRHLWLATVNALGGK